MQAGSGLMLDVTSTSTSIVGEVCTSFLLFLIIPAVASELIQLSVAVEHSEVREAE